MDTKSTPRRNRKSRLQASVKFSRPKVTRKVSDLSAKLSPPSLSKTFVGGKRRQTEQEIEHEAQSLIRELKQLDKEMSAREKLEQDSYAHVDLVEKSSSILWYPADATPRKRVKKKTKKKAKCVLL